MGYRGGVCAYLRTCWQCGEKTYQSEELGCNNQGCATPLVSVNQINQIKKQINQIMQVPVNQINKGWGLPPVYYCLLVLFMYIYMYVHMHDVMRGSLMSAFNGFARASLDIGVP